MSVEEKLFEAWAKEHPEEANELIEEERKRELENIKQKLVYAKKLREEYKSKRAGK